VEDVGVPAGVRGERVVKVPLFEQLMKDLLEPQDDKDMIVKVETFKEAGLTDKPYGLKVSFEDGSRIFVQFVRTGLH
jgi:hypothetical protein